jgi:hypothetical protein
MPDKNKIESSELAPLLSIFQWLPYGLQAAKAGQRTHLKKMPTDFS